MPDSGLGFQGKVLETFQVVTFSLGNGGPHISYWGGLIYLLGGGYMSPIVSSVKSRGRHDAVVVQKRWWRSSREGGETEGFV